MNTADERTITCCFTGYRAEKLPWRHDEEDPRCRAFKLLLSDTVGAVYASGCRRFLCGMATGADMYFAEAVIDLRSVREDAVLEGAIPFQGQHSRWSAALQRRYFRIAEACDLLTVLRDEYAPGCMMERNRYMVDRSGLLIAAYDGKPGGTQRTFEYAAAQGLRVIQLPLEGLVPPCKNQS